MNRELIDIKKQFGRDITFENVLPLSLNTDVELIEVQDKITDKELSKDIRELCISKAVARQWLFQARIKYNGKEFNIPAYPIGDSAIGSLNDYDMRTATGATLIRFKKLKDRKNLNIVFNYMTFLTLLSQDLISVKGGDFLILGYDTEADYWAMAERLRGKYATITYWLNRTMDSARVFTTDHTEQYGIIDTLPMLHRAFDIGYLWRENIRCGHPMPQWQSCARCALFCKCKPLRSRWHEVCKRYKPIDTDGQPTEGGKRYIFI